MPHRVIITNDRHNTCLCQPVEHMFSIESFNAIDTGRNISGAAWYEHNSWNRIMWNLSPSTDIDQQNQRLRHEFQTGVRSLWAQTYPRVWCWHDSRRYVASTCPQAITKNAWPLVCTTRITK